MARRPRKHLHQRNSSVRKKRETGRLNYDRFEPRQLLAAFVGPIPYTASVITDAFARDAVSLQDMLERAQYIEHMPGEVVVAIEVPVARGLATGFLDSVDWSGLTGSEGTRVIRQMMTVAQSSNSSVALVHLKLGGAADVTAAMRTLDNRANVLWSAPNFIHGGDDPREFIPNDPSYSGQYHHPLMGNNLAWDISLGNPSIRIGVTDDGVALTHPDLISNIHINPGEIAGNNTDDDSNGYIDDVNGWDFSSNNNDPNPNGTSNDHGTHVAGIAAGRTHNAIGIAGVAGRATIVPMQFYAGTSSWTAAIINATYSYAADNNIQIVTTSYNVDGWVGDPVFTAGLQYMYDAGVLHFNSAGNGNALNPPRQVFEQSLFVASTDSGDLRSSFSNYGTGIDIAAPGSSIFSTVTNNGYGTKSGTSMSTPNAAGAAALLWGANPSWNREQVAARLLGTATNIDSLNPAYAGLLGSGRVNTFAALSTSLAAPRIKSLSGLPADGSVTSNFSIGSFSVAFNQVMDSASVNNTGNFVLREAGVDGVFGNVDDRTIPVVANKTWRIGTNEMSFSIPGAPLEPGKYQLTLVSGGLQNPFGMALDGNGDGTGGDSFVRSFTLTPSTVALSAMGSLVYQQEYSANIFVALEQDDYFLDLDAKQTLTVVARASGSLLPTIQVRNPAGILIANVAGSGSTATAHSVQVQTAGRYHLRFGGAGNSTGNYDVRILMNAGVELESHGGATNNTRSTAQNIDATALGLGSGASDRLGVAGQLPSSVGSAIYSEGFESGSLGSLWTTFSSTSNGRIQVIGNQGTASGANALLMDTSVNNIYNLNHADWTINLAGLSAATLRFFHASFNDETNTLPATFTNTFNGDGVSISANGTNWYRVYSPTTTSTFGVWQQQTVDLVAAANAAGISLNSNFRIRFQQYDNYSLATDGLGYDDIAILVPAPSEDWYSFSLADGETASIAGTRIGTLGSTTIDLYDNGGVLLGSGVAANNISSFLSRFQDGTSNGVRDNYFVRVTGLDAEYSLIVTRQAEFDSEPNDAANSTAQDINDLRGVLGFATTTPDFYHFSATAGELIRFEANLPGGGPDLFANGLSSGGSSQLRMELIAPGGSTVANGVSNVEFMTTVPGTYYLRVAAQTGSGEYFVERPIAESVHLESGTLNIVGYSPFTVSFAQPFIDPVVIIGPPGATTAAPLLASVANVGPNSFDVRLHHWNNGAGPAVAENVSYLVVERGVTALPNGSRIVAGSSRLTEGRFAPIFFRGPFDNIPVIVATPRLTGNQTARTVRLASVGKSDFKMSTQYAEAVSAPNDVVSEVNYIAIQPGVYSIDNWTIQAGLTLNSVTHQPFSFSFPQNFDNVPSLVANIQTFNESDPAGLRMPAVSTSGATVYIGEEQTKDVELNHANEKVGYLALWQSSPSFAMRSTAESPGNDPGNVGVLGLMSLALNGDGDLPDVYVGKSSNDLVRKTQYRNADESSFAELDVLQSFIQFDSSEKFMIGDNRFGRLAGRTPTSLPSAMRGVEAFSDIFFESFFPNRMGLS